MLHDGEMLTLEQIKRNEVLKRLEAFAGNKEFVAKSLGITTKTLYNWLECWGDHQPIPRKKGVYHGN